MAVTTGMRGDGFYNLYSSPQMAAIAAVLPWLEESVATMVLAQDDTPVAVVDFSCSEGRNSIVATRRIASALRQRTRRPIMVVHSDLPTNDFNRLFINLESAHEPGIVASLYSACVGGSMFAQLRPPRSVTVAMTFNAIGFLNEQPLVEIADYILPMGPSQRGPAYWSDPRNRPPKRRKPRRTWSISTWHGRTRWYQTASCPSRRLGAMRPIDAATAFTTC